MILLGFLILGLVAGLISGGSFSNITNHKIRALGLPVASFLIKGIAPFTVRILSIPFGPAQIVVCFIQYLLLLLFILLNRRTGLWRFVFASGTVMNFLVILLNGGAMPVSTAALHNDTELVLRLINGEIFAYTIATEATHVPFLGDVIFLNLGSRFSGFASIGDFLIGIGIGLLAFKLVKSKTLEQEDNRKPVKNEVEKSTPE